MCSSSRPSVRTLLAALAHHDRRAGVLAHRQDAAGRDAGVLQQVAGDELVVRAGLRVVQDRPQLPQVRGPQQVRDVVHCRGGELREHLGLDLQELPPER